MDPQVLADYRSEAQELALVIAVPLLQQVTKQSVAQWVSAHSLQGCPKALFKRATELLAPNTQLKQHCDMQRACIDIFINASAEPHRITQAELGTLYLHAAKAQDQLQTAFGVINQLLQEPPES